MCFWHLEPRIAIGVAENGSYGNLAAARQEPDFATRDAETTVRKLAAPETFSQRRCLGD